MNTSFPARIQKIYDHLYANASVKTPHAIAYEFGKVAHTCLFIETNLGRVPAFSFSLREQRAISEGGTLLIKDATDFIRETFRKMTDRWGLYAEDPVIHLQDFDLAYCAAQLSGAWFSNPKTDLVGDIFEIIRSQFAKESGGQFFTDPQVTHLAITLLEFDPLEGDDLIDICAGTGGFLLAGMAHLEERIAASEGKRARRKIAQVVSSQFFGIEIDKDAASAANGTIKSRFGQDVGDVVSIGDSLRLAQQEVGKIYSRKRLCGATNPPFGTKITIKDPNVLKHFELARLSSRTGSSSRNLSPQAPDTLFLEQNIKLIEPEKGRLAIVVPYQLLSGPKALSIREWVIKNTRIRAVVDLPPETFQPHTGTKAGLLLVTPRRTPLRSVQDVEESQVFMAVPKHIGHDRRGNPVFRPVGPDGLQETLTDFPSVADAYRAFRSGRSPSEIYGECFTVTTQRIVAGGQLSLNAAYYRYESEQALAGGKSLSRKKWHTKKLHEVTERIFCPGRFKRNYVPGVPGAVPFLGGANIRELLVTGKKWLSASDPTLESLLVQPGWLLLTRSGSTGIVSSVPRAWAGHAISEHVIRIVPDNTKIDGSYLFAVLSSEYGQAYLRKGVFGSVIDEITPEFVGELDVPIPKNTALMEKVIAPIRAAEVMRNNSINGFRDGLSEFEDLLR